MTSLIGPSPLQGRHGRRGVYFDPLLLEGLARKSRDLLILDRQHAVEHFDDCPVSGVANPIAAEVTAWRDGEGVRARVVLGAAFEGAPGRSHGGPVAAVFDDVMGFLTTVHGTPTYAGELTVRYLSPVPVGDFRWHKTWQPVTMDDWRATREPGPNFTSVMTWQIESFTDVGGNKDQEFVRFIDLPSRTPQPPRRRQPRPSSAAGGGRARSSHSSC